MRLKGELLPALPHVDSARDGEEEGPSNRRPFIRCIEPDATRYYSTVNERETSHLSPKESYHIDHPFSESMADDYYVS